MNEEHVFEREHTRLRGRVPLQRALYRWERDKNSGRRYYKLARVTPSGAEPFPNEIEHVREAVARMRLFGVNVAWPGDEG